jgi:putative ABC transport system permease protein
MIRAYFKITFRSLWKHKLFTLINMIGLSIGISAALVIYLMVRFDSTFDKFYPDSDRIYRVVTDFSTSEGKGYNGGVCGPLSEAVRTQVTGLSESAPFFIIDEFTLYHSGVLVPDGRKGPLKFKYKEDMILADQRYFDIFPYHWLAGSKTSLNQPFAVVLTDQKAKMYFPGLSFPQMLGRVVIYGDSIKTRVGGIVEAHREHTDLNFSDFISYSTEAHVFALSTNLQLTQWNSVTPSSQFFVKLSSQASATRVEEQINDLLKANEPLSPGNTPNTTQLRLQKLSDIHFEDRYSSFYERTASKPMLYGLLLIGLFLLLLGGINYINLTTAQASQRAKEIGIRKTMGSSRVQLMNQFLIETGFITLLAILISAALTPTFLRLFADFIPVGVKADFFHQPDLILFLLLLLVIVSLLSGFYPAIILSGYKPVQVLKNQAAASVGKTRNALLRKSLTVTQFVIAQFFIISTLFVSKQIYYALHKDLGFKKEAILSISTPWNSRNPDLKQVYLNKIRALPQVEIAGLGGASPSSDNTHSTGVIYSYGNKEIKADVQERFGDESYIKVYGIKLLAGTNLPTGNASNELLINANFSKLLGFNHPAGAIGHFLNYSGRKMRIVGVVGDFYYRSLHSPIEPLVIVNRSDNNYFSGTLHIALKPETPGSNGWKIAISSMESAWKEIYPDAVFQYQFFDESIAKFYESESQTSILLSWSTGLSIIISCLGLLGLTIYTSNQRRKEIGIRKVLGATVAQIVTLLSTELILLILLAWIIVTPVAWWAMNKWIQSFADRTPISWWIFGISGGAILLAALLTSAFQIFRAALVNTTESLRAE